VTAFHAVIANDAGRELLGELPGDVSLTIWDGSSEPPPGLADVRFFATDWVPGPHVAAALATMPDLEVVQTLTAGVDHIAPIVPAGVTLANGRGGPTIATSEWVLTAILTMLRGIPGLVADQPIGAHQRRMYDGLDAKRVTILGYGEIGTDVERRLAGFDVQLTRVARSARDGVRPVSELDAVLEDTDILIVLTPLDDATRGMVTSKRLALLPDGALVVNAARGGIIDEAALQDELRAGRLLAALDVAEPDPLPPDHPLRSAPGLLYTPHVAGATRATVVACWRLVGDQLRRFATGEPLINVVGG